MDRVTIERLKQISAKKSTIRRSTENEEQLLSEEEQNLIRQLDSERDVLLGDMYFNAG